jgi:hypothetical protein
MCTILLINTTRRNLSKLIFFVKYSTLAFGMWNEYSHRKQYKRRNIKIAIGQKKFIQIDFFVKYCTLTFGMWKEYSHRKQ